MKEPGPLLILCINRGNMFNIEGDVNQINFNISNICDFSVSGDACTEYDKSIYFNIELILERGFFNILNCEFYYFELEDFIKGLLLILNNNKDEYLFSDERNIVNINFKRDKNSFDISVCYKLFESFDSECYITGVFYLFEEKIYDIINNIKPYLSEKKASV
ncbi:hypothetical protein [Morganella morganii]|uniref:hypothetical protein n=2 Tax=Morganella morganii TaxID=582 RepID=UPI00378451F8|nr:hypothetical protein SUGSMm_02850 [Morganella morganii subsp. sibonii]